MTRKNYNTIAAAIKAEITGVVPKQDAVDTIVNLAHRLAALMADDNPRFDPERFLNACGVGD
jgi:hypothetical protein